MLFIKLAAQKAIAYYMRLAYSTGQLQAFTYCTMLNVHLVGSIRLRYTMVILIVLELKQIQSNASFLDIW